MSKPITFYSADEYNRAYWQHEEMAPKDVAEGELVMAMRDSDREIFVFYTEDRGDGLENAFYLLAKRVVTDKDGRLCLYQFWVALSEKTMEGFLCLFTKEKVIDKVVKAVENHENDLSETDKA
mgnify:CR=1 FL=1